MSNFCFDDCCCCQFCFMSSSKALLVEPCSLNAALGLALSVGYFLVVAVIKSDTHTISFCRTRTTTIKDLDHDSYFCAPCLA